MKVAILQPSYLPWLGYFEQMSFVDTFIYLDDVQYTKNDWRNRNRIKTRRGSTWLTVPVRKTPTATLIFETEIDNTADWQRSHLNLLRENYRKAQFFDDLYPLLEIRLNEGHRRLAELTIALSNDIARYIGLTTRTILSSSLGMSKSDKNEKLISLCKITGADILYDGKSSENFIDRELFSKEGIEVVFQNYRHPEYRQFHPPFLSHLSVIDLLFHYGPNSLQIIVSGH